MKKKGTSINKLIFVHTCVDTDQNYTYTVDCLFFIIEKFSSLRLLIIIFHQKIFHILNFFFMEEFQNEILTKNFHNKNFKSEI